MFLLLSLLLSSCIFWEREIIKDMLLTQSQEEANVSQNNVNAETGSIQDDILATGSVKDGEAPSVMQKIRSFFKRWKIHLGDMQTAYVMQLQLTTPRAMATLNV